MGMDTKLHPTYDSDYDYLSRSHFQLNHISKRDLAVQGVCFVASSLQRYTTRW